MNDVGTPGWNDTVEKHRTVVAREFLLWWPSIVVTDSYEKTKFLKRNQLLDFYSPPNLHNLQLNNCVWLLAKWQNKVWYRFCYHSPIDSKFPGKL